MKRTALVYAIKNLKTRKYYVGSTRDLDARWENHRTLLESGSHTDKLQKAWNKSKPEDWEWSVLEDKIPLVHQFESEQHWIDSLDSHKNGYNSAPRAGSYVSIDNRGYKTIIEKRQNDVIEMLEKIESGVPYRTIASEYEVSLGLLSKLKSGNIDLFSNLVEEQQQRQHRIEREKEERKNRRKLREARDSSILKMISQGNTYRSIAKYLGCSLGTVSNVINRSKK